MLKKNVYKNSRQKFVWFDFSFLTKMRFCSFGFVVKVTSRRLSDATEKRFAFVNKLLYSKKIKINGVQDP